MYRFSNKVPTKYFISQGFGESDHAIDAGSLQKALSRMGISDCNIMQYSSVLPKEAIESRPPEKLIRGSVMDVIQARMDGKKGEVLTAGIIIGDLIKRTTGERQGSLVCQLTGHESPSQIKKRLSDALLDLFVEKEKEDLVLAEPRYFIESGIVRKAYGTAMVGICFFEYESEFISHYTGFPSFLGSKCPLEKSNYVITPVAYNSTDGSKCASAVLHASKELEDYHIETDSQAIKSGIHTSEPIYIQERSDAGLQVVSEMVGKILGVGKTPILIGDDPSFSIGAYLAIAENHQDFSILHLGAHAALRSSYDGSPNHSLCVMNRAKEYCKHIVHVGVRSMANVEKTQVEFDKVFFDSDLDAGGFWIDDVVKDLTKKVYVSIDASVFENGFMTTKTPEPGGMMYHQVVRLLKKVAQKKKIIGFDLTGFSPSPGTIAPEYGCAKLIYEAVSYIDHFKGSR